MYCFVMTCFKSLNPMPSSKAVKRECRTAMLIIEEHDNFHCQILTVPWKERATNENSCSNHQIAQASRESFNREWEKKRTFQKKILFCLESWAIWPTCTVSEAPKLCQRQWWEALQHPKELSSLLFFSLSTHWNVSTTPTCATWSSLTILLL